MRTLEYAKDVRPMALLEALQQAGLPAAGVHPPAGPGAPAAVVLDVAPDDTSHDAATDAVVAAHDPQAVDAAVETAKRGYDDAIAYLKNYRTLPTPTQQQTVNAVKGLIDIAKTQHQQLREQGAG